MAGPYRGERDATYRGSAPPHRGTPESRKEKLRKSLRIGRAVKRGTMALLEDILTGIVVLLIVLAVITFLELKYLRKAMQKRRMRAATASDLPDSAHNAILTSKAIPRDLPTPGAFRAAPEPANRGACG